MAGGRPRARGRPRMYQSPEEMQVVIDRYFKECEGEIVLDKNGNPMLDKHGSPIIIKEKPPTITGLALALGFTSRLALLNYQDRPDFFNTVTRAKARVEAYVESRLYDRDGAMGAKFSLSNNFKGWSERQNIEHTGVGGGPITYALSDVELENSLRELLGRIKDDELMLSETNKDGSAIYEDTPENPENTGV